MILARRLESQQFGFWLPVYFGDEYAERAIKRIVLREFRKTVTQFKLEGYLVRIKNFAWVQHETFLDCECERYRKTFGWKADLICMEISDVRDEPHS